MARSGEKIDELYISLGIDLDQFDTDYAAAQKKIKSAVSTLDREKRLSKLRLEVELAGFDNAQTSLKALKVQSEYIIKQIENQRNVVKLANLAYDEAAKKYGETNIASKRMQETLLKERKELAMLEKSLRQVNAARTQQKNRYMEPVGQGYDALAAGIAAASAASVKLAMDAVESESLFSVSFGNMSDTARKWSQELRAELGLNEYELRKNAGTWYVMFNSMGLAKDQAYTMSTTLTKLAYDMASFYNLDPKIAFEKLRSGISGEIEPLRQLGILVDEETVKQAAYTNGIARLGQELTQQQKAYARYLVILQQTNLAQGDLARTIDSPANQLRILRDEVKQLSTEFGMVLLPTIKEFLQSGRDISGWFNKLPQDTKDAILAVGKFGAEVAMLNTGMTAMAWVLGVPLPGWAKLALAIAAAVYELDRYIEKQNMVDSYNKDAEVRKNPITGQLEKRVLTENLTLWERLTKAKNDFGFGLPNNILSLQGPGKYAWMVLNADEVAAQQQYEADKTNEETRKKQEEENKRLDAERKRQLAQEKLVADEKAKIAKDLQDKLYKYTHSELDTELRSIDKEVEEHKKKYTEIAGLDEWAEKAKAEVRKKYAREWADFAASVTESELQNRLRAIDREKEAWITKVGDEVKATQLAEEQKKKVYRESALAAIQQNKEALKLISDAMKVTAYKNDGSIDEDLTKQMRSEALAQARQQILEKRQQELGIKELSIDFTPELMNAFSDTMAYVERNVIPGFGDLNTAVEGLTTSFNNAGNSAKLADVAAAAATMPPATYAAPAAITNQISFGNIQVTIQSPELIQAQNIPNIADQVADQVADKIGTKLNAVLSQSNQYGYSRG